MQKPTNHQKCNGTQNSPWRTFLKPVSPATTRPLKTTWNVSGKAASAGHPHDAAARPVLPLKDRRTDEGRERHLSRALQDQVSRKQALGDWRALRQMRERRRHGATPLSRAPRLPSPVCALRTRPDGRTREAAPCSPAGWGLSQDSPAGL